VLTNDMRVSVPDIDVFTYPNVVMVCGEPEFTDDELDTLINPTVIVEALSTSTEGYDRGLKFAYYRSVASLTDYVLIAQDRQSIEHYARQEDGTWHLHDAGNQGGKITLAFIGCELDMAAVYRRVSLAVAAEDEASEEA
jgi:Uma2 family endonuclease